MNLQKIKKEILEKAKQTDGILKWDSYSESYRLNEEFLQKEIIDRLTDEVWMEYDKILKKYLCQIIYKNKEHQEIELSI